MACSSLAHGLCDNDKYNVDKYGLLFRCLPRRTYLAPPETRKTARGCKAMKAKYRITGYACTNASGTHQVPMGVIGKTQQPRCFKAAGMYVSGRGVCLGAVAYGVPTRHMEYQLNVWVYGIPRGPYMSTLVPENRGWTYCTPKLILQYCNIAILQ